MQRRITEAHLILIVTFVLYMGYQWLMQWIPIKNVIFHMLMGQVMLVLPGGLRYFVCCRKKQDQLAERMLFVPISNANIKMAVAVIISAYPVIAILNSFSMLFVKHQVAAVMPYMSRYFVRCLSTSFQEDRNFSECADFRTSSSELQSDAVCCLSGNCICIDGGGNRFDLYIHAYAFFAEWI